ncbi:MAG: MFS transporter [Siculibacillus sp.]|nr:MFS transporter [Siculibacillus sp.]
MFASSFVALGVQLPFFPVLLAHRGLSDTEIAMLVATPMILRVTTVSTLGAIADRVGDRRKVLVAFAGAALVGCLLLGPAQGFWQLLGATIAMALFWNGMLPVTDALATSVARRGAGVYGQMRLWGSIAFVVGNLAGGWLVGLNGGAVVYPLLLASFVLQFVVMPLAPGGGAPAEAPQERPPIWAGLAELVRDRRLMTILAGAALVQSSHAMLYGFASLYWGSIGFSGGEIGAMWAVAVVGEVILFALADRAILRMGARGLLLVGGVGAVARWCLFPFVGGSGLGWTMLQLLHAASFAATHLGTMHVVTQAAGDRRAATVQGLTVTVTGLAMATSTLASGRLYAAFGGTGFLGMAVAAGIGTLVLVAALGLRRDAT